jgi:hypothetical protein
VRKTAASPPSWKSATAAAATRAVPRHDSRQTTGIESRPLQYFLVSRCMALFLLLYIDDFVRN